MKASGLIILLAAAVMLLPVRSALNAGHGMESPRTVCEDSTFLSETAPQGVIESDDGDDTAKVIIAVVVIIIVIYFISCIADTGTQ